MDDVDYKQQVPQEMINRLISLGATEDEARQATVDVCGIIVRRFLARYAKMSGDTVFEAMLESGSVEDVDEYMRSHKDILPPASEDLYRQIAEETWSDYFKFMSGGEDAAAGD